MKKQILPCMIVSLGMIIILSCSSKSGKPEEQRQQAKPAVNDLPNITLIDAEGQKFSTATLTGNTILIFFSADCDHCQREAKQIHENLASFGAYTLYFVSMDPFPAIDKFATTYDMSHRSNIHFERADGASVFNALGYMKTPTICIYNRDRKLIKRFDGETKIEEILKLL